MLISRSKALLVIFLPLVINMAQATVPDAPALSARSFVIMDYASGEVIASHNPHEQVPPASLTKLMTAYIVEKEIDSGKLQLTDPVMISENAWRTGGSRMFVNVNTEVTVEELLRGIIIQSGNDASTAMAEKIAGSEDSFAGMMNQTAESLGMKDTHFMNATGLPNDEQYSSAYDMALLARAIIQESETTYYPMYSEKYFVYNDIRQPNRNRLLWWDSDVDGLKTGYTEDAGYCLVASSEKNGMRLITVVMGAKTEKIRTEESKQLLTYGFRFYESKELYAANTELLSEPVWKGEQDTVAIGVSEPLRLVVPRDGSENNLETLVSVSSMIEAPIAQGQELGTVQVISGDKVLAERPLIALNAVEKGGFFTQLWDSIKLFFSQWF